MNHSHILRHTKTNNGVFADPDIKASLVNSGAYADTGYTAVVKAAPNGGYVVILTGHGQTIQTKGKTFDRAIKGAFKKIGLS